MFRPEDRRRCDHRHGNNRAQLGPSLKALASRACGRVCPDSQTHDLDIPRIGSSIAGRGRRTAGYARALDMAFPYQYFGECVAD
jgi:hypothetical protein